jgi:hypothetical protein
VVANEASTEEVKNRPAPFLTLLGEADALGVCDVDGTCC